MSVIFFYLFVVKQSGFIISKEASGAQAVAVRDDENDRDNGTLT